MRRIITPIAMQPTALNPPTSASESDAAVGVNPHSMANCGKWNPMKARWNPHTKKPVTSSR